MRSQTVKPGSQDLNVKGKPTAGKPKTGIPDPFDLISKTITYGAEKLEADGKNFYEGVKRGASQVGSALMSDYKTASDPVLDCLEYLLELRKQTMESFPILAYKEKEAQAIYALVKQGVMVGTDWVGNKAYEADIPNVSDFLGGLLDASSMEDNGSPAAVTGSFVNGGARSILSMVDGLAYIYTDPAGALEGVTKIARDPDVYGEIVWDSANSYMDENLINGSAEDRARFSGYVFTEIVVTVLTLGAGKAGTAGKAGKTATAGKAADAVGTFGDMGKLGDMALDARRAVGGVLDEIGNAGGDASKWIAKIDDVAPKKGVSIESVGKGGSGAGFRDMMSPEEIARYDSYWNNVADDMLKSNIDGYQQSVLNGLIAKTTGGKINSKVLTAAIDTNTGDIYYGISGMNNNPTRGLTNSQMQSILDQVGSSKMNYPLENCGEFNAINNALNNGVDIGSLRVYSIERVGGIYKPPCINCQNLYGELLHFTQ